MPQVHIATPDGRHEIREESEVRDEFSAGKIPGESLYWMEGMSEWRPIQEFLERALFTAPPPVPAIFPPIQTSRMAIAAIVLAAVAWILLTVLLFRGSRSIPLPLLLLLTLGVVILSLLFASCAWDQIQKSNGKLRGRRLAVGSTVLIVLLVGWVAIGPAFVPRHGQGAGRIIDATSLRAIGQASLVYAYGNHKMLPPAVISENGEQRTPGVHDVAKLLAQKGGMNDADLWFSVHDKAFPESSRSMLTTVVTPDKKTLTPEFAAQQVFSFDYVTGLSTDMPPTTPIAWTRGLRLDGTWDPQGVYGTDGGYIVFLSGHVQFFKDLRSPRLLGIDGKPTSNILDTLPSGTRIVGSGPASLDGYFKPAETQPAQPPSAMRKPAPPESASPP